MNKKYPKLYDQLTSYCQSDAYPFHMPGHKRRTDAAFLAEFPNPYGIDITEIDGFDNLHHAEGILKESMKWAASVYGTEHTYYLVNGSTCGVLAAVCAAAGPGGTVLMARNSHKSAYHAAALQNLNIRYVYPEVMDEFGLQGGILPEEIEKILKSSGDRESCGNLTTGSEDGGNCGDLIISGGDCGGLTISGEDGENCGDLMTCVRAEETCGNLTISAGTDKSCEDSRISAVFITSPTYDGVVSDVRGIAEVCHRYGVPLIVDEAHGAHFPFGTEQRFGQGKHIFDTASDAETEDAAARGKIISDRTFPLSALYCGADIVIHSLHKTLPAFTQTALLHVCGERVDVEKLEYYLQVFQTSSPSYVMMAGIERCVEYMAGDGRREMERFAQRLGSLRASLRGPDGLRRLRLLERSAVGPAGVYDLDESKIIVSTRFAGESEIGGSWLAGRLREIYHLEMEMCGADYVTAIVTLMDTEEGLERLRHALLEIDRELEAGFEDGQNEKTMRSPGQEKRGEPGEILSQRKISEPGEVLAQGEISKPGELSEPRELSEPEKLSEQRGLLEQEKLSEQRELLEQEKLSEPRELLEPGKLCGPGESSTRRPRLTQTTGHFIDSARLPQPRAVCSIHEALCRPAYSRRMEDCEGRISGEYVYLYPPGIPILAPGEIVTREILDVIADYRRRGLSVQGLRDHTARELRVIGE